MIFAQYDYSTFHKGGYRMISYKHEPFTDFSLESNYNAYVDALNKVESYLGEDYPLIVGGERITTEEKIVSYNPAKKKKW